MLTSVYHLLERFCSVSCERRVSCDGCEAVCRTFSDTTPIKKKSPTVNLTAGPEPGHDKRCHCHKPVINVSFTEGKRRKRDAERERKQVKEDPLRKRGAAEGLPFNLDKGLLSIEYICRIFLVYKLPAESLTRV